MWDVILSYIGWSCRAARNAGKPDDVDDFPGHRGRVKEFSASPREKRLVWKTALIVRYRGALST